MTGSEPVDPRVCLAITQWPPDAPRGAVTTFCVEHQISRKTFYAIRKTGVGGGAGGGVAASLAAPEGEPDSCG